HTADRVGARRQVGARPGKTPSPCLMTRHRTAPGDGHTMPAGGRRTSIGPVMRIATWNLNHRVGRVRFRPEAAQAIVELDADVIVLTEFYPQQHEGLFRAVLEAAGW